MEMLDLIIPFFVVGVAAFMVNEYVNSKAGLLGGAVMGVIVLYGVGLIGSWGILLSVLGLASLFFCDNIREART